MQVVYDIFCKYSRCSIHNLLFNKMHNLDVCLCKKVKVPKYTVQYYHFPKRPLHYNIFLSRQFLFNLLHFTVQSSERNHSVTRSAVVKWLVGTLQLFSALHLKLSLSKNTTAIISRFNVGNKIGYANIHAQICDSNTNGCVMLGCDKRFKK